MTNVNHDHKQLTRREFLRYGAGLGLSASSIALLANIANPTKVIAAPNDPNRSAATVVFKPPEAPPITTQNFVDLITRWHTDGADLGRAPADDGKTETNWNQGPLFHYFNDYDPNAPPGHDVYIDYGAIKVDFKVIYEALKRTVEFTFNGGQKVQIDVPADQDAVDVFALINDQSGQLTYTEQGIDYKGTIGDHIRRWRGVTLTPVFMVGLESAPKDAGIGDLSFASAQRLKDNGAEILSAAGRHPADNGEQNLGTTYAIGPVPINTFRGKNVATPNVTKMTVDGAIIVIPGTVDVSKVREAVASAGISKKNDAGNVTSELRIESGKKYPDYSTIKAVTDPDRWIDMVKILQQNPDYYSAVKTYNDANVKTTINVPAGMVLILNTTYPITGGANVKILNTRKEDSTVTYAISTGTAVLPGTAGGILMTEN